MRYVDAGYAIALVVLALYSVSLLARRRRLERAADRASTLSTAGTERRDAARAGDAADTGGPEPLDLLS